MLKRLNKRLHIGISHEGIALLQASSWRKPSALLSESTLTDGTPEQLASQLSTMIAQAKCKGQTASLVLSDHWARLFVVSPPQNATRLNDCRAAAHLRFQALYGESLSEWELEADWDARKPFLACALPRALLGALRAAISAHHVTLIELTPHFVAAWNRSHSVLKSDSWLGTVCGETLTLGIVKDGELHAVRSTRLPPQSWHEGKELSLHIVREALRLHLPPPERLQLCGNIPATWATHSFETLTCERLDAEQDPASSSAAALARIGVHA